MRTPLTWPSGRRIPHHAVSDDYRALADEVIVRARLGAEAMAGAR